MLRFSAAPPEARPPWIVQVCDALIYLHEQQPPIVHRDIKLPNITSGQAMLVDFGIAKLHDPTLATTQGAGPDAGFTPGAVSLGRPTSAAMCMRWALRFTIC
jgi:serine/threonine-protein kinase